jgi:hypothetical protein
VTQLKVTASMTGMNNDKGEEEEEERLERGEFGGLRRG